MVRAVVVSVILCAVVGAMAILVDTMRCHCTGACPPTCESESCKPEDSKSCGPKGCR
jgi:hypothetical protein